MSEDSAPPNDCPEAVRAAFDVLDRHMAGLNANDPGMINDTLHFPHYRLAGSVFKCWADGTAYFADFLDRAGEGWARSAWDFRRIIAVTNTKVHVSVQFTRYRADNSELGQFKSLWVITCIEGRWAAQLRSSFAS